MPALNFDANTVLPNEGFSLIPKGDYTAIIASSEVKKTTKGDGEYLSLKFQILAGEFQNRTLFANLNMVNPNEKAVAIARGDLSAICRAVGVLTPKDSSELHNKPLTISIGIKADNRTPGETQNVIRGYKARNAGPVAGGAPANTLSSEKTPWG